MNKQTVIDRAKKWQSEFKEFLAWAESSKESELTKILKSYQPVFSSLVSSLDTKPYHKQDDFWPEVSTYSEVQQTVSKIRERISKLKLPTLVHARSVKGKRHADSRN